MAKSGRGIDYSTERIFDEIVGIRASEMPHELEMYAEKWAKSDNYAVLAAIIENENAPYSAIEIIVEKKWDNREILKLAYKHENIEVMLKEKIKKELDKNPEPSHAPLSVYY